MPPFRAKGLARTRGKGGGGGGGGVHSRAPGLRVQGGMHSVRPLLREWGRVASGSVPMCVPSTWHGHGGRGGAGGEGGTACPRAPPFRANGVARTEGKGRGARPRAPPLSTREGAAVSVGEGKRRAGTYPHAPPFCARTGRGGGQCGGKGRRGRGRLTPRAMKGRGGALAGDLPLCTPFLCSNGAAVNAGEGEDKGGGDLPCTR
ncbi:hypothetical protein EDB83DRAFT_2309823 [Lactarius deliciosus]|nr:hypothetical protein EDB83DRAFT_2309823 [Lactarius deliciosus]